MQPIQDYLKRGPSTSKEIQTATGLSQSSVSRMIKGMGDRIVQIPEGRSVLYAATCNAFGCDDKIPLSMVDHSGKLRLIAYVRPLNCGRFFLEWVAPEPVPLLLGESGSGLYDDLPYFLLDLRPQGFLGRQIAQKIAARSDDFPSTPKAWNTNHIGRYLISNGEDLTGNLIFGEQARLRIQRKPVAVSRDDYPMLAEITMKGDPPGSSAGGEQPKFTAYNGALSSHVIVKFSPKGNNEIATRWRDILITEYHANRILGQRISPTPETALFEKQGRLFLESKRLDRVHEFGRASMISLDMIDREFCGLGSNWVRVAEALYENNLIDDRDLKDIKSLSYFGDRIHNTDMHLGNLSFSIQADHFKLLPVYDMCSMGFAPKSAEVLPYFFELDFKDDLHDATVVSAAIDFWEAVMNDPRSSDELRAYLSRKSPAGPKD